MKVIALNGSPRDGGNTRYLIEEVAKVLQDAEGLANLRILGENMAWILEKIHF